MTEAAGLRAGVLHVSVRPRGHARCGIEGLERLMSRNVKTPVFGTSMMATEMHKARIAEEMAMTPAQSAAAMMDFYKKNVLAHGPTHVPTLLMYGGPKGSMLVMGDPDDPKSPAKTVAWVSAWTARVKADRYILSVPVYVEPLSVVNDQRKRVALMVAVEDREQGQHIEMAEVIGDANKGEVQGYIDKPLVDDRIYKAIFRNLLPPKSLMKAA